MKIEHLAIWTKYLEETKNFYVRYFNMVCSEKYINQTKRFESYFLSFPGESTRIELMQRADINTQSENRATSFGITHFSISVGSKERVDELTNLLRDDGFSIIGEPRTTGDGYYESFVLDPESNMVEITA